MNNLLSVTEVAALAQVGRQYIKNEIWRGNLPATKIGSQYVITRTDFDTWMDKPRRGSRRKVTK
jgi:excisionase family DNA binding protein